MEALVVKSTLECSFFISSFEFKMEVYLEGPLEFRTIPMSPATKSNCYRLDDQYAGLVLE
jgi:hypothetical protein